MAPAWTLALLGLSLGAAAADSSSSRTIRIEATSDQTFSPATVAAAPGDVLAFHFQAGNHSVAMGVFGRPCTPADAAGFFSGFWPVQGGEGEDVFLVTVSSADPFVFYSTQSLECAHGMSGVVNPAAGANGSETLTGYQADARGISMAVSPSGGMFGGVRASAASVADAERGSGGGGSNDSSSNSTSTSTGVGRPSPTGSGGSGGDGGDDGNAAGVMRVNAGLGSLVGLAGVVVLTL